MFGMLTTSDCRMLWNCIQCTCGWYTYCYFTTQIPCPCPTSHALWSMVCLSVTLITPFLWYVLHSYITELVLVCGSLLSNEEMVQGLLFEAYLLQHACVVSNRTSKECHKQCITSIFVGICVPMVLKTSKLTLIVCTPLCCDEVLE
jgi:hypothetical protein